MALTTREAPPSLRQEPAKPFRAGPRPDYNDPAAGIALGVPRKESVMGDLIFVAVTVAFFALTVAYVAGCERIVGRDTAVEPDLDSDLDTGTETERAGVIS
jgi:hypothetical protein